MMTTSEIWIAFARMAGMLFVVLAVIILGFYLIKRFSTARSMKGPRNLINVIATHHLSPKEKLVLLTVMDETILIGVTPQNISKISRVSSVESIEKPGPGKPMFSEFLSTKLKQSFPFKTSDNQVKTIHDPVEKADR